MHGFEVEARSGDIPVDYNGLTSGEGSLALLIRCASRRATSSIPVLSQVIDFY
jgi:hypothetical protein